MASVQIQHVVKSYDGKHTVVHDVDLSVGHGEFVVLVGPSGCGKSTLLRMIAGLESVSGGDILIDGQRVNDLPPRDRDIAMVFQDYALYPHKTLYENMAFGLRLRKHPEQEIRKRVMDSARLLQIDHMLDRKPAALSGGQRQRVAIGRAIVRQPKVFLFDEPLSNLDAQLRAQMRTEIKKLHQRLGATIIYVTHDQVEAMTLADRIAVLSSGRLMQYGRPTEVYDTPAALFVASFTGSPAMNLLAARVQPSGLQLGADCLLEMPASWLERAGAAKRHVLGVRPEDVHLNPGQTTLALTARVILTEPLGAETLVTFGVGEGELVARCPSHYSPRPGTQTQIYLESSRLHLFDADGGGVLR